MGLGIPPLRIKMMLESNPLKSTMLVRRLAVHPVSITRFPLRRFSPGAGLLINRFVHRFWLRLSRGWVRKDGNLLTEIGRMLFLEGAPPRAHLRLLQGVGND